MKIWMTIIMPFVLFWVQDPMERGETVRIQFKALMGQPASRLLAAISPTLSVKTVQQRLGAIELTIEIYNDSDQEAELWNPRELVQTTITDKNGIRLNMPQYPPKWIIDTVYPDKIPRDFKVLSMMSDSEDVTREDSAADKIRIPSKQHYRILLRIDRILSDPRQPSSLESRAIPPGRYAIKILLTLWSGPKANIETRAFETTPIEVEVIE